MALILRLLCFQLTLEQWELIKGKIAITVPTFDEYPSIIPKQQLVEFRPHRGQFSRWVGV